MRITATPNAASTGGEQRLLNELEVAERLNMRVATLRRWRFAGKPPAYVKVGAAVRYRPCDIEAFVISGRIDPEAVR